MISIEQAFEFIDQTVHALPTSIRPVVECVGHVLVSAIQADMDSPPHDKSVMDGFAVRSEDVTAGTKRLQVIETIIAGDWPKLALETGQAARIMTGAPIPAGADAVVMVELTETEMIDNNEFVTLNVDSLAAEKNILRTGVNFSKGQTVFANGHIVRPTDVGLLAEVGAARVATATKPTVSILPTGNELVSCDQFPGQGQIRNSNGPLLNAMAKGLGLSVTDLGVGRDDPDQLRELIERGLNSDLLLLSGGVSAGTMDLVPGILNELGVTQVFHKVKIKPGKPIWFGVLERNEKPTYVFGLPGNPVSSMVGFQLFVRAAIRKMMGTGIDSNQSVVAELTIDHQTRGDRPTYWPGKFVNDDTPVRKVQPLVWRGSSDLFALGEAEGLIVFPANVHESAAGLPVRFHPF